MLKAIIRFTSRLFSSIDKQTVTVPPPVEYPGELAPSAEWLIKEASVKTLKNIEASDKFKKIVLDKLIEYFQNQGDTRIFKRCIEDDLINESWDWPEFDHWFHVFKKDNEWPPGWTSHIIKDPDPLPTSISESLLYLTTKDIKAFLKEYNLTPKPMPQKRDDWATVICEKGDWNLLKPRIGERHEYHKKLYLYKRMRDKLNLLFTYLVLGVYGRLRYYQTNELMHQPFTAKKGKVALEMGGKELAVEKEFAEKFNKGEIADYPPFFPGCSMSVSWVRSKRE
jgi:hypothetical protein